MIFCCCCRCALPVPSHCLNPSFDLSSSGVSSNQSTVPASIGRRQSEGPVVQRDAKRLRNSELPRKCGGAKSLPPLQLGAQVFSLFVAGASASREHALNTKRRDQETEARDMSVLAIWLTMGLPFLERARKCVFCSSSSAKSFILFPVLDLRETSSFDHQLKNFWRVAFLSLYIQLHREAHLGS